MDLSKIDLSKIDISKIPPSVLNQLKNTMSGNKNNSDNKPYSHNEIGKMTYVRNSNEYILKIDSKDRNINREPNPFDFSVSFNRNSTVDASINSRFQDIKYIEVAGASIPRRIPAVYPGKLFKKIYAVCNGVDKVIKLVPLPGVTVRSRTKNVNGVDIPYIYIRQNNTIIGIVAASHKAAGAASIDETLICAFYQDNQVIMVDSVSKNSFTFSNTVGKINENLVAADFETIDTDLDTDISKISLTTNSFTYNDINNCYVRIYPNSVLYLKTKNAGGAEQSTLFYVNSCSIDETNNKTILNGTYSTQLDLSNQVSFTIQLFNAGYRDLLDEKYFLLSFKPFNDIKETGTNDAASDSYCLLLPLPSGNNNIILSGHSYKIFNYRNLKNLNQKIELRIYDSLGNLIGEIFNDVHDDLKTENCYRVAYNIKLKEVDRHLI